MIEIAFFFRPVAEEWSEANEQALSAKREGCATDRCSMVRDEEKIGSSDGVLMYINPSTRMGEKFMKRCVEWSDDRVIVPDLSVRRKRGTFRVCEEHGIDLVSFDCADIA